MTSIKLLFVDGSVPDRNVITDNISKKVILVDKKESLDNIDFKTVEQIGFVWKNYWRSCGNPQFPRFTDFVNDSFHEFWCVV